MARTTAEAVRAILLKDYDAKQNPSLVPFITTASAIIDRVVTCALEKGTTLTTSEQELIERWLAAHFYAQSDKPYSSKTTAGASASFHGQTKMYLESTLYGQTAVQLDPSGCLSGLVSTETGRRVASIVWLGKPPSEQLDYWERD